MTGQSFVLAAQAFCRALQVRKLFGVKSSLFGALPGRVTYVVDKSGVIRHTFNSQLQFAKHSKEALDAVKALA
jgi:peroxiredoxin Q/BCP